MKFKKEDLQKMAFGDSDSLVEVEQTIVDQRRWVTVFDSIFWHKETGKHYKTYYEMGSTECQENEPFEYRGDEIECTEVEEKKVTVKKWVEV